MMIMQNGNIEAKSAAVPEVAKLLFYLHHLFLSQPIHLSAQGAAITSHLPLSQPFHLTMLLSCSRFSFSSSNLLNQSAIHLELPYIL
jgi:hypothetical protein